MPDEEDWVAIDSEITDKNARIRQIDEQITDKSKLNEQEYQRKANIQKQIGENACNLPTEKMPSIRKRIRGAVRLLSS